MDMMLEELSWGQKLIYKLQLSNKKPIKFHLMHVRWPQRFTLSWVFSMAVISAGHFGMGCLSL